jgi:predicted TIM-barrel fold metal-dependent hydrolase
MRPPATASWLAWIEQLVRQDTRLKACVAWTPLELGATLRPYLERLSAQPLVRGVRRILQTETDPEFCLKPEFIEGVRSKNVNMWRADAMKRDLVIESQK